MKLHIDNVSNSRKVLERAFELEVSDESLRYALQKQKYRENGA